MLISRLFKPLDYLRVYHSQKRKYDLWIPLIIATIFTGILFYLPTPVDITGDRGLLVIFTGLLQILIGFYIASLAAVATFDRPSMDEIMRGDPPTLRIQVKGKAEIEYLTRRRFLCLMFGYLSLLSFFLYFLGAFANLFKPSLHILIPMPIFLYVKWFSLYIYIFFVSNLVVASLLGLFYMTERIHREEDRIIRRDNESQHQNNGVSEKSTIEN